MATTNGTNNIYPQCKEYIADGSIDIDNNAFGIMLLDNGYSPGTTADTDAFVSDVSTHEIAATGNYSRHILSNVQWIESGNGNGQMKFTATDPVWNAIGGSIAAWYWVLFHNTPSTDATKHLLAYGYLDSTPAEVSTAAGNTLTLNVPTDGFFTFG